MPPVVTPADAMRIRLAREQRGWTQAELAKRASCYEEEVASFERDPMLIHENARGLLFQSLHLAVHEQFVLTAAEDLFLKRYCSANKQTQRTIDALLEAFTGTKAPQ